MAHHLCNTRACRHDELERSRRQSTRSRARLHVRRVGQLVQTHMEDMEVSRHMAMVMVVAVVVFIVGDCARCGVMATSKDARLAQPRLHRRRAWPSCLRSRLSTASVRVFLAFSRRRAVSGGVTARGACLGFGCYSSGPCTSVWPSSARLAWAQHFLGRRHCPRKESKVERDET